MSEQPTPYRFTVDEYEQLGRIGFFSPDDRLELIDGEILLMSSIGARHASHVRRLVQRLTFLTGGGAIVCAQDPIRLGDHSEPQPDVTVLRPRDDFYANAHPTRTCCS